MFFVGSAAGAVVVRRVSRCTTARATASCSAKIFVPVISPSTGSIGSLRPPVAGPGAELGGAGGGGHALCRDADPVAGAVVERAGRSVEGGQLLGGDAGDGGVLVLGVPRIDGGLCVGSDLASADAFGDMPGQ